MKAPSILVVVLPLFSLSIPACQRSQAEEDNSHSEQQRIVVTNPQAMDVTITQPYVCQIRSQRNIEIRALEEGYLEPIRVKEGQAVEQGDALFKVVPALYKARWDAEFAEVQLAQMELNNTRKLFEDKIQVVSQKEVSLFEAKLAKAKAKLAQAEAELNFTVVKAPFDGIIDRFHKQQGSLVQKEEILTTLSDNSVMWVYFNVPEARYLEYKGLQGKSKDHSRLKLVDSRIDLVLANGSKFNSDAGDTVTIEGKFNNENGNIAFRADFPNPDRLLRHGQTGTVMIHQALRNAIVIPQRATFEILDKRYVWVVGEDHVAHQRPLTIDHELEDIYVVKGELGLKDKIILEGGRQVRDGDTVEYEFQKPEEALAHQKYHAE